MSTVCVKHTVDISCLGTMLNPPPTHTLSLLYKGRCLWGVGSESWPSGEYELQGSLDVTICGLQRPQHQILVLDPHVPQLLHLGLPAALAQQKHIHRMSISSKEPPV